MSHGRLIAVILALLVIPHVALAERGLGWSSYYPSLIEHAGTVYFIASDTNESTSLFRSGGTPESTVELLTPAAVGVTSFQLLCSGTSLFVVGRDEAGGVILRTDGTPAGTTRIANIAAPDYYPYSVAVIGDTLIVFAASAVTAVQTLTGATASLASGATSDAPVLLNDRLYFRGVDGALMETDGSMAGTERLTTGTIGEFAAAGSTLFFAMFDLSTGTELWAIDSAGAMPRLVSDIRPGATGSSPQFLKDWNGELVFRASTEEQGEALWRSDGTAAGTSMLVDVPQVSSLDVSGPLLFFRSASAEGSTSQKVWRSDGTPGGTFAITPNLAASLHEPFAVLPTSNGSVFPWSSLASPFTGIELWTAGPDGTAGSLLTDIAQGSLHSHPALIRTIGGKAYFRANDEIHGIELWVSDGTPSGTKMLLNYRKEATLSGHVVNETGEAIPSAFLYLYSIDDQLQSFIQFPTGPNGAFRIEGLRAGTYVIGTQNADGYIDEAWNDIICNGCNPNLATHIVVEELQELSGFDFVLAAGARISGTITSAETGAPIPGVRVSVRTAEPRTVTYAVTDASGQWQSRAGLTPDAYFLVVNAGLGFLTWGVSAYGDVPCGYTCAAGEGTPINVEATDIGGINVALLRRGQIHVSVVDDYTGQPLESVQVAIFDPDDPLEHAAEMTDTEGVVEFPDVPPGALVVELSKSDYLTQQIPLTLTGGEIETLAVRLRSRHPQPLITSISPTSGPPMSNSEVFINGTGFTNESRVYFGGSEVTVLANAPEQLMVNTPHFAAGRLFDVMVWNGPWSSLLSRAFFSDFNDVPQSHWAHPFIEKLVRGDVTTGCAPGMFCPADGDSRATAAAFIARALNGGDAAVPDSGTANGVAWACGAGGHSLFTDVPVEGIFCRHTHYLLSAGITVGCAPSQFCPSEPLRRDQLATLVARALAGSDAAVPRAYSDPTTGRSYDLDADPPQIFFADSANSPFARHIHYIWARGIVDGCGPAAFCPTLYSTRAESAKMIANSLLSNP